MQLHKRNKSLAAHDTDRSSFLKSIEKKRNELNTNAVVMLHGDEHTFIQQLMLVSFSTDIYVDLQEAVLSAMDVVM